MDMDKAIHECECLKCQARNDHPEWQLHHQMNLLVSRLDEQQRRWYVAAESRRVGHGGDKLLSQITGLDVETIRRGRRELEGELADRPPNRVRKKGGGRPSAEKRHPGSEGG
jgi:hypothetical protein